jgi:hypothetical protein
LTNVDVELFGVAERDGVDFETLHVALELAPDVVGLSEGTLVEVVGPCPIFVPAVCEGVEGWPNSVIARGRSELGIVGSRS